jgi:hypothetical protein
MSPYADPVAARNIGIQNNAPSGCPACCTGRKAIRHHAASSRIANQKPINTSIELPTSESAQK